MKKNMKLMAVISTASLLAMGAAFTSMAATGWVQENGTWRYYDRDGYYVTDEWKKSNNDWYYLDSDGKMATDCLIEDGDHYYAVDSNGVMIKNAWREFEDESDGEMHWFYFQSSGKAKDNGFLMVDENKYHFTDGKMDEGWLSVDDSTYLLNTQHDGTYGAVVKGWAYVEDFDDYDDVAADEEGWYYFGTNGKMVSNCEKQINGAYYVFDENGLMLDNWVAFTKSAATGSNAETVYKYYKTGDGQRMNKWVYLDDMSEDEGRETEEGWYYFKNGVPYSSTYKTTLIADGYGVAKINNKIYCFDSTGKMVTGKIDSADGTYFYFDDNDGAMKYGKVKIEDSDDLDDGTYYFANSGAVGQKGESYTGDYKGYLYNNGMLVKAEDGMKYEKVTVAGKDYMVNKNGKIVKSGTVKDADGVKWSINKDGAGNYIITIVE